MLRRGFLIVLDVAALVLLATSHAITTAGGFIVNLPGDVLLRLRSPGRSLLWLAVVLLVRLALDRRAPFGMPLVQERFDPEARAGRWRTDVAAAVALALTVGLLLSQQVRSLDSVPDVGDPLFSIWRMGWVKHQLATDPGHLFDANIFYPERLTLTYSDPIILPALMSLPFDALGLHPVVAYNLLMLAAFWLSGVAAYLLIDRLTGSAWAAWIGALVFTSYSYRFEHYSHLELQMTLWMPLGLLALHRFFVTARYRYAVALALAGVAQLYSSLYYGVFFLIYTGVIGIGLMAFHRPSLRRVAVAAAIGAAIAAALAQPIVRPFGASQFVRGERTLDEVEQFSAVPSDYLRTHKHASLWKDLLPPPVVERALFPGIAPVVLAAIGAAPPFSAFRLTYAAALLVCYDLSLGLEGWTYPWLHRSIGAVRNLRAPARFSILFGLTLAVLAGFGARRILSHATGRVAAAVAWLAISAFVIVEARPTLTLVPVWAAPPPVYEDLPRDRDVVLAELPITDDPTLNTPFMYFSLWHWRPMVNGYSGNFPESYITLMPNLMEFPRGSSVDALRGRGVTHVVYNCGLRYPDTCDDRRRLLRASSRLRLIHEARWQDEPVELYELIR